MQSNSEERKGIKSGNSKYLNRYPLSGKIQCSECGSTFKRRIHGTKNNKYIAWCCSKHITNIEECSMIFIREDAIYQAFVTMINKLIFSHKIVLRPLLQKLKSMSHSDNLAQVQEIEAKIEDNAEQLQLLMNLMTKGYLEPVLFNSQNNELRMRAQNLKEQKEILYKSINGGLTKITELERLIKYVSKLRIWRF